MYAVLQQLTGLTSLAVIEANDTPPFLTALCQLQRLYLLGGYFGDGGLPAGGWMGSLQWLCMDASLAMAGVRSLAQATCLSHLSLSDPPCRPKESDLLQGWLDLWQFAASHPPLHTFELTGEGAHGDPAMVTSCVLQACARLAAKRPSLHIVVQPAGYCWPLDELLTINPADDF